jgi:molybdate transport repressor ModE-like protein
MPRDAPPPMSARQIAMKSDEDAPLTDEANARPALRMTESAGGDVSVRRLQALWAIAHTGSITRAAKLLGVTQPSLSQQLAAFESSIGGRLFERRAGGVEPTELGASILARAEHILRSIQELEDSLTAAGSLVQHLRIAGAGTVMRALLPHAIGRLGALIDRLDFDLNEAAPGEVLEALYARRSTIGIVAAGSVPDTAIGFRQAPVVSDRYVLAVPERLDLGACAHVTDLRPEERTLIGTTMQFVFGTNHSRRIQDWYDRILPGNRVLARVRSFETMIEMTRAELGVCIAPTLAFCDGAGSARGLRLYDIGLEPRRIVALYPSQYHASELHRTLLTALSEAGQHVRFPHVEPMPPFVARALADQDREA